MGLTRLFNPKSVAVIGASREPHKVGHATLQNIIRSGFRGEVFPVNPRADEILGLKAYPSVLDIPTDVDLAVIAVPASVVPSVVEECGKKRIPFAVIISAGFREVGEEGQKREIKITGIAKKYNLRIVGPNCLGILDLHTPINASFSGKMPKRGNIAFISQSGALISAILDWSLRRGIGFSKIVSLGNKADLNETDFIEALGDDPYTRVILLYLESIEQGKRFVEVSARVSRRKPIVLLKGGVTDAGARAAKSHTGAMIGSSAALRAATKKAGIFLTSDLTEFFDIAMAFSFQEPPQGNKVCIITNAGGVGVVTADQILAHGLKLAELGESTKDFLRSNLPPMASIANPIDVIGDARASRYRIAIDAVLSDRNVDGAIIALTPQAMTEPMETAKAIVELNKKHPDKPILAIFLGGEQVERAVNFLIERGIPTFDMPERAVKAMASLCEYRRVRELLEGMSTPIPKGISTAKSLIQKARAEKRKTLLEPEAIELIRRYGIPAVPTKLATSLEQAIELANEMGYPVALKIASPDILHKADVEGIALNIRDESELKEAYERISRSVSSNLPTAQIYGVTIQKMAPKGKEVIIGVNRDPVFGHVIMFGLGGALTELFKDISYRLTPLSPKEAEDMITETKAYYLLKGFRGARPSDIDSVIQVLLRTSSLVTDIPEISEMDINPLFVYDEGEGCQAVDVKVVLS